jgi:hypothetical protein
VALLSTPAIGIRNTTTVFDAPARERVRQPRHIPADGVLVPYDARAANGQYLMKELNDGAYRDEFYVAHISRFSPSLPIAGILLNISRHPWGRQHRSPYRHPSCFLLVKKVNVGMGPALHAHSRGDNRRYGDSARSQGREGARQVHLYPGQVVTELVLQADRGGCEVF